MTRPFIPILCLFLAPLTAFDRADADGIGGNLIQVTEIGGTTVVVSSGGAAALRVNCLPEGTEVAGSTLSRVRVGWLIRIVSGRGRDAADDRVSAQCAGDGAGDLGPCGHGCDDPGTAD